MNLIGNLEDLSRLSPKKLIARPKKRLRRPIDELKATGLPYEDDYLKNYIYAPVETNKKVF